MLLPRRTSNADQHAIMPRMYKPHRNLGPQEQGNRDVEFEDVGVSLLGTVGTVGGAAKLVRFSPVEVFDAWPAGRR